MGPKRPHPHPHTHTHRVILLVSSLPAVQRGQDGLILPLILMDPATLDNRYTEPACNLSGRKRSVVEMIKPQDTSRLFICSSQERDSNNQNNIEA